jgi:hypothetical protein
MSRYKIDRTKLTQIVGEFQHQVDASFNKMDAVDELIDLVGHSDDEDYQRWLDAASVQEIVDWLEERWL